MIFISPQIAQKGRGHLKHDFRLTERLLPDSTMTYRGRSDSLVVESDIIFKIYLNVHVVIYATYKDIALLFFLSREGVAPIALMDKPCQRVYNLASFDLS